MHNDPNPQIATVAEALANTRKLIATQQPRAAADQARAVIRSEPDIGEAHLLLSFALRSTGQVAEADRAEKQAIACALKDPVIIKATEQIADGKFARADQLLGYYLADTPNDPVAVHLRARVQMGTGRIGEAQRLLGRALKLAPGYEAAQQDLEKLDLADTEMANAARPSLDPIDSESWFTSQPGAPGDAPDE